MSKVVADNVQSEFMYHYWDKYHRSDKYFIIL